MVPRDTNDRITTEWGRVYAENPSVYQIPHPERIARLGRGDFMTAISKIGLPTKARVLEAGCGSGRDSLYLASCGHRVVALDRFDTPRRHLAAARARYENSKGPIDLEIVSGDILDLPFAANEFDLVFNSGVLEHYACSTKRAAIISEMVRVARHGGLVAISVPNLHHPFRTVWDVLLSRYTNHDNYDLAEVALTTTELRGDLDVQGLEVVFCERIDVWETISHFPRSVALRGLTMGANFAFPRPMGSIFRRFGTRLLVCARKRSRLAPSSDTKD